MKRNIFRKIFTSIFIFIYICTAPEGLIAPVWADIIEIKAVGENIDLHSTTTVQVGGSDTGKVIAIMVNNGGSVFNQSGDTLTIKSTNNSTKGGAVGIQLDTSGANQLMLEGLKTIDARSEDGYARTIWVCSGSATINAVEKISAYGGCTSVAPESTEQPGLAYAVQGQGGDIDLNGNNTVIIAETQCSNAAGIGAQDASVVHADGIKSITATADSDYGTYTYAVGIVADGRDTTNEAPKLYLNTETGSPHADITVDAPSTTAYAIAAYNGAFLQANVHDLKATGAIAGAIVNFGADVTVDLSGNIKSEGKVAYGVVIGDDDSPSGTTTVTGTGANKIEANSTDGKAYAVCANADEGSIELKKIGDIIANGTSSNAYGVHSEGFGDEDINIKIEVAGTLSASATTTAEAAMEATAVYSSGYSNITISGGGTAQIKATATGTNSTAYAVYAYDAGTVTINNAASITGYAEGQGVGAKAVYSYSEDSNITINGGGITQIKAMATGENSTAYAVYAEDGGTVTLNNIASVTGDVEANGSGSTVKLKDVITINGGLSVSGTDSYINISGTSAAHAVISGEAVVGADSTMSLTNTTLNNSLTTNGILNITDSTINVTDTSEIHAETSSGFTYNNAIWLSNDTTLKNVTVNETFADNNTGHRVRGVHIDGDGTMVKVVTDKEKVSTFTFDRGEIYSKSQTGWTYGISLGDRTSGDNASLTFSGEGDLKISGNNSGGSKSDYGWSINGIRVNGSNNKLTFSNTGTTTITESSHYGVNAIVNYGTTEFTAGKVLINSYLHGGVANSNNVGLYNDGAGSVINVSSNVEEMTIFTEGAGYVSTPGSGDISDGAAAIYDVSSYSSQTGKTGETNIYAKNLNILAIAGEDTNKQWTIGTATVTGHTVFDKTKAGKMGQKYSTSYGIKLSGAATIRIGANTNTSIWTRDTHLNSVAVAAIPYKESYYEGKVEILGNTNILAEGDTGTKALYALSGSSITVGSEGKTVSISGDIVSDGVHKTTASNIIIAGSTNSIKGNVTVSNGGNFTTSVGTTDITGTLNITGAKSSATLSNTTISGNATNEGTLTIEGNSTINNPLTNSGTLDLSGTAHNVGTVLNVDTFEGKTGGFINFDANATSSGSQVVTDSIVVTTKASGEITLGSVSINVKDSAETQTVVLFKDKDGDTVTADFSTLTIDGTAVTATSDNYKYEFKQDTTNNKGNLIATAQKIEDDSYTLQKIVQAYTDAAGSVTTYSLVKNDYLEKDNLGTLTPVTGASTRQLTISGNGCYSFSGTDTQGSAHEGITVGDNGTLSLQDLTSFGRFKDGLAVNNSGTLIVSNSNITDNLTNNGILNVSGETTFDKDIKDTAGTGVKGTMNINSGTATVSSNITQAALNIASGATLGNNGGTITAPVENSGNLTLNANAIIDGTTTLNSGSTLNVTAKSEPTLKSTLTLKGATVKVEEEGVLNVDDDVTVVAGTQNTIDGTVKGNNLINNGNLTLNANTIINGATTLNSGSTLNVTAKSTPTLKSTLTLKGATVKVEEEGVLNVDGDVTVAADTQNTIEGTVTGEKLVNNGTLTASASDLKFEVIENNSRHTLILPSGELSTNINSTSETGGAVVIDGDVKVNGITFTDQHITVNSGKELCFSNGKTTITNGELIAQNATLGFCLDGFAKDSIIVDASANPVNLTDVKVNLWQEQKPLLAEGESLTLLKGATNYTTQELKTLHKGRGIQTYKYSTYLADTNDATIQSLMAEYLGEAGPAEEAKSLSEGFIAGSVALMQAGDLAATTAIETAQTATQTATTQSVMPYAVIQGGHGRYHTGSHVDMNSVQIAAGVAQKFSDSTIAGILIEGGNGRYTSYNEFTSGELRADGEVKYYGAGIFAKHSFSKSDMGNAYVDASFSAGRTNQDYRTAEIRGVTDYHYDIGVIYLKAHATAGYEWHLGKASLDGYVKYLWSCQNGATVKFNEQDVNFDAINSHRVRVGARYTQKLEESIAWYGGLAYEYEFDASAGASSMGLAIAEPDLKGGSGMAEIGLKYMPLKANNWTFDLGLEGFTGKRDSLSVRLAVWYMFNNKQ